MSRLTRIHALGLMALCLLVASALRLPELTASPPGLHYDEAANGVLAAEIGLQGERPVFIASYTGKEVLFFYMAAGAMRLLGDTVFSLRLAAAFSGILTVAATYWLGREILADRRIALIAAALLAISFWHVLFSRLGFRAVTQPLLQALAVAALFRGLRRQRWTWLLAAGIFLGLTAYTYLAARLFPIVLLLALLPLLLNRAAARQRWRQLLPVAAISFLVALPLLLYFYNNPEAFWVRISQVAPGASQTVGLAVQQSYLRSLGMMFLVGDPYWRFNLPGRPLFNWFWGALLLIGWLGSVLRWRRLPYDWQRAALLLLIAVPLLMVLPAALATGEIVPSNLRAIGLIPFIFYLPAIGVVTTLHYLETRFAAPPADLVVNLGLIAILIGGGLTTARLYFQLWSAATALFYESDGDLAAVAPFLDEANLVDKTLYVASLHDRHPTLAFLSDHYEEIRWLPESQALALPASGAALYVFPHSSPAPAWARSVLAAGGAPGVISYAGARPVFTAYELAATPELNIPNPAEINFGNTMTLLGYEVGAASAGSTMLVTLYWRVEQRPNGDFMPFLHLEDSWGHRWSQVETNPYPARQWQPGETIIQRVDLPLPSGTPPGAYQLRLGLFEPVGGERLPRLDEAGRYAGDSAIIEQANVSAGPLPENTPQPPYQLSVQAATGLELLGYERGGNVVETGESLPLALWWQATEPLADSTLQLDLEGAAGTRISLLESAPVHGTYPFAEWQTPQFVIDRLDPRLPDDLPAGDYRLVLRLLADAGPRLLADLGPLTVRPTDRIFSLPAVSHPLDITLGEEIALRGYELEATGAAGEFELTLVWQALRPPAADYTVFVHLLGPDGACSPCIWQQDAMPHQDQYPTSRWTAGEVIADVYTIRLPADLESDAYPLEVGLYSAATGQRLAVVGAPESEDDAIQLQPLLVD